VETLYIEASLIECSEERREISGKIVPMGTGEVGNTNLGGVVSRQVLLRSMTQARLNCYHSTT